MYIENLVRNKKWLTNFQLKHRIGFDYFVDFVNLSDLVLEIDQGQSCDSLFWRDFSRYTLNWSFSVFFICKINVYDLTFLLFGTCLILFDDFFVTKLFQVQKSFLLRTCLLLSILVFSGKFRSYPILLTRFFALLNWPFSCTKTLIDFDYFFVFVCVYSCSD